MKEFDVCVLGAGPGGYVSAIRAAQLGLKTVVVEREYLGGVCLNVGCIPSKAMITAAHFLDKLEHHAPEMGIKVPGPIKVDAAQLQSWKQSVSAKMAGGVEQLLKGNQVSVVRGEGQFESPEVVRVKTQIGEERIKAKQTVIAIGSRPIEIPGFKIDEKKVLSSTGALALKDFPKSLVVIGGGYIGLEIGSYLSKFGVQVTILEAASLLLQGVADPEAVQIVARRLKKAGVQVHLKAKAKGYKETKEGVEVEFELEGKIQKVASDAILLTVGRKPNSDQLNLGAVGVKVNEKGFIQVDAKRRTTVPHIYAIGDVAGQPMLAHKASHEGLIVAEVIAGKDRVYDAKTVPAVIFTDPEIASAGYTEEECKQHGFDRLIIGKFPFAANGRAVSLMEAEGFVKIIADEKTQVVKGVHIVGPEASNLISEAALAIEMGARVEDMALTIHPHPTLGETMMEAAEATLGHAIHVIQRPLWRSSP